jgi:hypothetical protein
MELPRRRRFGIFQPGHLLGPIIAKVGPCAGLSRSELGKADRGFQYSEKEARSVCGVQQKPSVISAPAFAGSPLRASLSGWSAVRWPMLADWLSAVVAA